MVRSKLFISLILLFICSTSVLAQKDNSSSIGISFTPTFYSYTNLNDLNNHFKAYNYPAIKNNAAAFSFGVIFSDTSNVFYDLIEIGAISAGGTSNNLTVTLSELRSMITFILNLNYNPANKRKVLTGPILGFGLSYAKLSISDKPEAPQTFDSSLASLKGQREITSNNAILINLGWSVEKSISKRQNCFIALKAGYDIDLNHPKWQFNNVNLSGNPRTDLSGFYASLQLNFVFKYIH